jgi:NTE family protein
VTSLGRFDDIRFDGLERTNSAVLAQLIEAKPGEPVTEEALARDLRRIYGRGDYDTVDYRIEEGPGSRVLVIKAHEKETGPNYVRFGLSLASDFKGDSYFNAAVSYRKTWINQWGAEWLTTAQMGRNSFLHTEFLQPFKHSGELFAAPWFMTGKSYRPVFLNDQRVATYERREIGGGVDFGTQFGQWGEFRVGPMWREIRADVDTGPALLPDVREKSNGVRMFLFGDRLDAPWFPREGHRFAVAGYSSLKEMGADRAFTRGELSYTRAWTWREDTVEATLYGGSGFGTKVPAYDSFVLGGPFRLSGYAINQFSGQEVGFAQGRYLHRLQELPNPVGSGVYAGASLELGRMNRTYVPQNGSTTTGNLWSTSVFLGADTALGPAWVGFGFAPGGNRSFFMMLGVP